MSRVPPALGSPGLCPALVLCMVTRQRGGFTRADQPTLAEWEGPGARAPQDLG